jgi:acyl carrier protein
MVGFLCTALQDVVFSIRLVSDLHLRGTSHDFLPGDESLSMVPLNDRPIVDEPVTEDRILSKVISELVEVFGSRALTPPPLSALTILDGSLGLESLDFAELVVRLEQAFGKDPFASGQIPEIRTIEDLALLYR